MSDTIFALASGAGRAGVAVFRVSGPEALSIGERLAGRALSARTAHLATLKQGGETLDSGLVIAFPGPASFTGEDVCELHVHGSRAVAEALSAALARLGARPADAGEFTRRAFANGKLDLAQTEALADLIDSETEAQRKQALGQFDGRLSALAEGWRARLVSILAPLEAAVDFPDEEDVPAEIAARATPEIAALRAELETYRADAARARTIRAGISVALIGAPNAGKSSLLNRLSGMEAAIVSETPGTTRDVVEVRMDLAGLAVNLADTAGLRETTADAIEAEGMRRAAARAAAADIRIVVAESGSAPAGPAVEALRAGDFLLWNKSDLKGLAESSAKYDGVASYRVSAKTGEGVDAFLEALGAAVAERYAASEAPALTRVRHRKAVEDALEALSAAEAALSRGPELAAEDVRLAARALGRITGAVDVEDVLDAIFSSFCIGK